jgi:hypothetical protein
LALECFQLKNQDILSELSQDTFLSNVEAVITPSMRSSMYATQLGGYTRTNAATLGFLLRS